MIFLRYQKLKIRKHDQTAIPLQECNPRGCGLGQSGGAYVQYNESNVSTANGHVSLSGFTGVIATPDLGYVQYDEYDMDLLIAPVGTYPAVATMADAAGRGASSATIGDNPARFKFLSGISYDALGFVKLKRAAN